MEKIMKIGIDVSMNSTGLVINNGENLKFYKIISEKKGRHSKNCELVVYDRIFENDNYSIDNISKIYSAEKLSIKILKLIEENFKNSDCDSIEVYIEGGAMGGFGGKSRINDMTIFSSFVKRKLLTKNYIKLISVVPPTTLKKFSTGKGNCSKKKILEKFYEENPDFEQVGKNDDVADAYFLSFINSEKANIGNWTRK